MLETMYKFQKLLQLSYERTKRDYRKDYSKAIIANILNSDEYSAVCFKRLILLFVALILAIIVCFCYLYF